MKFLGDQVLFTDSEGKHHIGTVSQAFWNDVVTLQYTDERGKVRTAVNVMRGDHTGTGTFYWEDLMSEGTSKIVNQINEDLKNGTLGPAVQQLDLGNIWDLVKDGFQVGDFVQVAKWAVAYAEDKLPGASGEEKKAYAKTVLIGLVEKVDNLLPWVGQYMDLPPIDALQKLGLNWALDKVWAWGVHEGWLHSSAV